MPAVPPCDLPTEKEHKRARRRFLQKQPKGSVATPHGALAWQQRLADKAAFNAQQMKDGFLFYPFCGLDDTCLPLRGWAQLPNVKVPRLYVPAHGGRNEGLRGSGRREIIEGGRAAGRL